MAGVSIEIDGVPSDSKQGMFTAKMLTELMMLGPHTRISEAELNWRAGFYLMMIVACAYANGQEITIRIKPESE